MTTYTLHINPDDADNAVETFKTKAKAVKRGAEILTCEGWNLWQARKSLSAYADCRLGDAGSLRITVK